MDTELLDTTSICPIYRDHLSIFKLKICEITFKIVCKSSIMTLLLILHVETRLFQVFTKRIYQSHMLAFFTIAASNERRPPVYTLHLKCFPIKGEPRSIENISYRGYSSPKCTCNGHVPHFHIQFPSKNMQFLLWNPTCHAMK